MLPKRLKVCKKCGRVLLSGKKWIYDDNLIEKAKKFGIEIVYDVCDECKKPLDYHNAVVQIRGKNMYEHIEDAMDFLDKKHAFFFLDKDDIKVRYKKDAKALAKYLENKGAKIKYTAKVVGYDRQKSKQLQRLFISAKFDFAKNDIVLYKNRPYKLKNLSKNRANLYNFGIVKQDDLKILDIETEKGIIISKDPFLVTLVRTGETIEPIIDENIISKYNIGDEVEVVEYGNKWYLVM